MTKTTKLMLIKKLTLITAVTAARSWTAQQRLCGRFARLITRKTSHNIITVAIARELARFCWAEMTATD